DFTNWSTLTGKPASGAQTLAGSFGNGNFVLLGISLGGGFTLPPIFTSTDGTNWVNQQHAPPPPTGPSGTFTSIASTNGVYVAVTSSGIVRSTNGLAYTTVTNLVLTSVACYKNTFVGVGSAGAIYQSSDGISWTQRNSATANNLRGVTASTGLLVAVGDN